MTDTIKLTGKSGTTYTHFIYPISQAFEAESGNYAFLKRNASGRYGVIYVGETKDLSERFGDHHKMPCIKGAGATHLCVHVNDNGKDNRLREESDLVQNYNPCCNG